MEIREKTVAAYADAGEEMRVSRREEQFLREYRQTRRKGRVAFGVAAGLLAATFLVSFCVGRYAVTPARVLQSLGNGRLDGVGSHGGAADAVHVHALGLNDHAGQLVHSC